MPGDVIVGDEEGAVVIPAALVEEVATDAYQQELEEEWAFEVVAAGDSTIGAFPVAEAPPGVRGLAGARDERGAEMTRRSINVDSFRHSNPIPAAAGSDRSSRRASSSVAIRARNRSPTT